MTALFLVLAAAAVFAIAAVAVGRIAGQLGREVYRPRFDLAEAVSFVAAALPAEEAAQLTHADVRRLITWHVDELERLGLATEEAEVTAGDDAVVADEATVAKLHERARAEGHDDTEPQVRAVLTAELAYLEAIGAIGRSVEGNGA